MNMTKNGSTRIAARGAGVIAIAMALMLLSTCTLISSWFGRGTLVVGIEDSVRPRTYYPTGLDLVVATYDIVGSGPSSASFTYNGYTETELVETPVLPGTWSVTVTAKNATGTAIGYGENSTTVGAEQSVPLGVTVTLLPGNGTAGISISWPIEIISNPVLYATRTDAAGTTVDIAPAFTVNAGAGTATYTDPVPAGGYVITLKLKDSSFTSWSWGRSDAYVFAKDKTTSATFALTEAKLNQPPDAPASVVANQDGADIDVTWTLATYDITDSITVERSKDGGAYATAATLPWDDAWTTSFLWTDAAPDPGSTYAYRVTATNTWGAPSATSAGCDMHYPAVTLAAPVNASATKDTTPDLSWNVSAFHAMMSLEYAIQIASDDGFITVIEELEANAPDFAEILDGETVTGLRHTVVTALDNDTTYYWRVLVDKAGMAGYESPWSEVRSFDVAINAGIDIDDGGLAAYTVTLSGEQPVLYEDEVMTLTATAPLGADSWAWYLDGDVQAAYTTSTFNLNLQDRPDVGAGNHTITVKATKSGRTTSESTSFFYLQSSRPIGSIGPAGGIVFYDKGSYSDGWRYLEAARTDQSIDVQWGGYGTSIGVTGTGIGTGKANTDAIVVSLGSGTYAARICYDLVLGGYDDWFLPSKDELNLMYGQMGGIEEFASDIDWSSSENNSSAAWMQYFSSGDQDGYNKLNMIHVRAVRAF